MFDMFAHSQQTAHYKGNRLQNIASIWVGDFFNRLPGQFPYEVSRSSSLISKGQMEHELAQPKH